MKFYYNSYPLPFDLPPHLFVFPLSNKLTLRMLLKIRTLTYFVKFPIEDSNRRLTTFPNEPIIIFIPKPVKNTIPTLLIKEKDKRNKKENIKQLI